MGSGKETVIQFGEGHDLGESSFQFTDVGFNICGNVFDYLVVNIVAF